MGGPQGPSVSRSPGATPQEKAGRPMGPSTPLVSGLALLSPCCGVECVQPIDARMYSALHALAPL